MLHLEILDEKRTSLLPLIAKAGESFYLAGGTSLALQFGHRDSIDFDFFIESDIDTKTLFTNIETIFSSHDVKKTQDELNTLSVIIDGEVRLSFFGYRYPLVSPLITDQGLNLATSIDIGCMKLSAITSRATLKDYVDIYFIFKELSLSQLLTACTTKYSSLDHGLILKSLVYFDDLIAEPIMFIPGFEITIDDIKNSLTAIVKDYWTRQN